MGPLTLYEDEGLLVSLDWCWTTTSNETGLLTLAYDQLTEYFDGERETFSLPFAPKGTAFQLRVWSAMCEIPYGDAWSYGDLAKNLHTSPRAVGAACGRNPLPIFLPCHRVVGSNGALTGYSGGDGLVSKDFLLDLERGGQRLL